MDAIALRMLLEQVQSGGVGIDEALAKVTPGVVDIDFAQIDLQRKARCGFPEVIFSQGKTSAWIEGVIRKLAEAGQDCLATRLSEEHIAYLAPVFPLAEIDGVARTFWLPSSPEARPSVGNVLILTAGTSDLPVALEALVTARAMGCGADVVADVGVAGLHRLLRHLPRLESADAVIVVAGMDGALPSVVGGLVSCPVIAVPTSVGYGACFGGVAPLLTMLNACSAGVVVVNIDAGFKAGYTAALIGRRRMA